MSTRDRNTLLLAFAWLVAIAATAGSLYYSQIRHFIPCELCWYQRIFMYPLVLILGIATFFGDARIRRYALPMALVGGSISVLHYAEQKIPGFAPTSCAATPIPCNIEYVNYFGFVTIAFMALTAFVLIALALAAVREERP
ncbi:disulfide oxidoreductase [Oceanithermus sp.]|uniref:disulfide oxidoreductase n=1 Tax=Oceanithermus sp. TaxID=2268145 RepID=UPI00257F18B9|nr:disulfide oxidoreductase [Oceanithermus sp.]